MDVRQLADGIAAHGGHPAKPDGNGGYLVCCPCHDDSDPSLHLWIDVAGELAFSCLAGCNWFDLKEKLNEMGLPVATHADHAGRGATVIATYDYNDEAGELVYQVVRYEPKGFKQRRPNGNGGWTWNLKDTHRLLFRLPELVEGVAAGKTIYITEGEKDALAIAAAGGIATCNSGGAGKWRAEFVSFLRGAEVLVVADKDAPGKAHATAVAGALEGVARSVCIVEAKVGKDAADHLAAGKTLEEFVDVDRSAVGVCTAEENACAPSPRTVPSSRRLKLTRMAEVVSVPVDWLWEARIPRGKLAVVAGDPGLGKSYLTLKMAAIISTGGAWPDGSRATPAEVLIISAEDDAADTIRPRLDRLGADVTRITMIDGVLNDDAESASPFSLRLDVDLLRTAIIDTAAVMVIVDPLNAFLGGIDSHKAAEVRGVLSPLAHVAATTHAAVLAVHHLNKGTSANALYRASGSLDFVAAARIVHGVAADPELEGRRVFVPVKCNIAAMPEGLGFRIGDGGVTFDDLPVTLDAAAAFAARSVDHKERSERDMAKDFVRDELSDGPMLAGALFATAEGHGFSKATVRRAAADLQIVKRKSGFQGPWEWSLPRGPVGPIAPKDSRPRNVVTFATFGKDRLDREEGMSTFDATEDARDDRRPSDATHPDDDPGAKDDHAEGRSSLAEPKDTHAKRRDTFDAAEPSGPDLDGDKDDIVVDHPLASVVVDEGDHPDDQVPPWSADL